jgi:5-deoxy-glucuronate isomerase
MSKLLVKPTKPDAQGRVVHITPKTADWSYVGFDLHLLKPGHTISGDAEHREICLVLISGRAQVAAGGEHFGIIGERTSPFEGRPYSIYTPAGSSWTVTAETELTLAVCSAPGKAWARPARLIAPADLGQETRGTGTNTRYVTNILPEMAEADSLLVVEVITPGGHTSSYPPHKHDVDDLPRESLLEETYYHRLKPSQGFAFQRVYTDDRSLDEAMAVEDGDVTLVPKGYHPCAATHGYDLYYLNVMAGPKRTWRFHNAKEHEWLLKA